MEGEKSLRTNNFPLLVFKHFGYLMKADLMNIYSNSFGRQVEVASLQNFLVSFLFLPKDVADYRPIDVMNRIMTIVTKVLTNPLKVVAANLLLRTNLLL